MTRGTLATLRQLGRILSRDVEDCCRIVKHEKSNIIGNFCGAHRALNESISQVGQKYLSFFIFPLNCINKFVYNAY